MALLKMHWTPDHAQPLNQWPEQHLDVSSTTSSPAHKSDVYQSSRQRLNYAWANDDISALTASNLLKRYAEKYSGVLDSPYERAPLSTYTDGAFGPVNGQKGDLEPWQMSHGSDSSYTVNSIHDSLAGSKSGNGHIGLGSPTIASGNLPEPLYPGSTCGAPNPASSLVVPQDYTSTYSGTYLPSGYCSQPTAALPVSHPSSLHSSGLQPTHPSPALVHGYSSSGTIYNYSSSSYATQPGYGGMHPAHPSGYLPSGIAAPTPLPPHTASSRPTVVPGYTYQSSNLAPISITPLSTESSSSLKRKAFDMTAEESEGKYRKYGYEQPKTTSDSSFPMSENVPNECRGNGFNRNSETPQMPFKPGKHPSEEEQIGKYNSQSMKAMISPTYNEEAPLRSGEAFGKFTPPVINGERRGNEQGHVFTQRMQISGIKPPGFCNPSEDQLKNVDPLILELVNNEIVDCAPPVQWTDIAGHVSVKAAIEEELVWPILRPGAYTGANRPPKSILLFGPSGSGKTLLSRCIATQLGSTFLKLNSAVLVSKWKNKSEKVLQTVFYMASCHQPTVVFISEIDLLLSAHISEENAHLNNLKSQLLSFLDGIATSTDDSIIFIGTSQRPNDIDEAAHHRFAKRFYIAPPDNLARRQILHHTLAQQNYCLSEREMALLVQHTEGYSGNELIQLCQQAGANHLHGISGQLQPTSYKDFEGAFCKLRAGTSQKQLDLYVEWNKMYGSRH
ncbi:fidgetin-like isoform 1-T2 [Anomaloglossus baeobatrachus]|uniref:fidgetin-like n=1 Tax=Anomaloglossus baeobatrachus TaxID=238106 RepID=UPI003F4F959A